MKTLFIPCYSKKDPTEAVGKAVKKLEGFKRIGLVTTAQHLNKLDEIKEFLEKNGKEVVVGGQVLGCDQSSSVRIEKDVDAFLYIGSGRFHPLGVGIKTDKKVIVANPYSNTADEIGKDEKNRWLKRQRGRIMKGMEAKTFGILISTKEGQFNKLFKKKFNQKNNLNLALKLKERIESVKKKAFLFAGEEINPGNVLGFEVDAWVNTACLRLVDDHFDKPVLNLEELEHVLDVT